MTMTMGPNFLIQPSPTDGWTQPVAISELAYGLPEL